MLAVVNLHWGMSISDGFFFGVFLFTRALRDELEGMTAMLRQHYGHDLHFCPPVSGNKNGYPSFVWVKLLFRMCLGVD